ncbi:SCO family protein [Phaeodactylibacter luteus]|nr:SCO family protein [Phaeodactylibacter luteus]
MMRPFSKLGLALSLLLLFSTACQQQAELPILSPKDDRGSFLPVPDFSFVNQDSMPVSRATFAGKAYVADFFFTSCPTICPVMAQQMLRIQRHFSGDSRLLLLSHTIDPGRDTVPRLKTYAENLGAIPGKWHFVTGDKDSLYDMADDYYNLVVEDQNLPDGFDHSGRFTLVGPKGYIRSYCNGTSPEEVGQFIKDIETLLHEMEDATAQH